MDNFGIGYFLNSQLWGDAQRLVQYQIEQKTSNKFYNTIDNIYYDRLNKKSSINPVVYFKNVISNNLFYGLEDEFFAIGYSKPKSSYGVRKYMFFSYPLRITHFGIGLYLLKLTNDFLDQYVKGNKHINSFYGGDLRYNDKDELILKTKNIYFIDHYREFKKAINHELGNIGNKIILHVDIENYFDHLSIQRLLEYINGNISHSSKVEHKFDNYTMDQISFFYRYLMRDRNGIPQSGNDIISGFLGYLFLVFADLQIDDYIVTTNKDLLKSFKIIRYVDDIYIVLDFKGSTTVDEQKAYSINLLSYISDLLYYNFGLRVNNKTRLILVDSEERKEEVKKNLKKASSNLPVSNDDLQVSGPQEKLNILFNSLRQLKEISLDALFYGEKNESGLDPEVFKEIYNDQVGNIIMKSENIEELKHIFSGFNFDLIKVKPSEILLLIMKVDEIREELINSILKKTLITTNDRDIIIEILCQTGFDNNKLIEKLNSDDKFKPIISLFDEESIKSRDVKYFDLDIGKVKIFLNESKVIKQIELRVMEERLNNYSVALNHLVNEIHTICYVLTGKKNGLKNFNVNHVIDFLRSKQVPHKVTIKIKNMFDRRNNNLVSHSVDSDNTVSGVSRDEYYDYKKCVKECLNIVIGGSS